MSQTTTLGVADSIPSFSSLSDETVRCGLHLTLAVARILNFKYTNNLLLLAGVTKFIFKICLVIDIH